MWFICGNGSATPLKNVWAYSDGPVLEWSEIFGINTSDYMDALVYDATNDKLYIGGLDDDATGYNLFRLTASDGSSEIGRDVGAMARVRSIAQKTDGTLIVGGDDASSHGLFEVAADLSSETAIGTNALRAYSVMIASDDKIYAAREAGHLEKWSDGEYVTPDWSVDLGGSINFLNELSNGTIVCGEVGTNDKIFCRSPGDGAEVWTNTTLVTEGNIVAIYVDSNNDIYVFWYTNVSKLDPADGAVAWTESLGTYINGVGETDEGILALAGQIMSGSTVWTFDQSTKTLTSLEITHDGSFPIMYATAGALVTAPEVELAGTITGTSSTSGILTVYDVQGWPLERPTYYDADKYFDIATETWVTSENSEGGRYKEQLVAIGQDNSGNGVIYYGDY